MATPRQKGYIRSLLRQACYGTRYDYDDALHVPDPVLLERWVGATPEEREECEGSLDRWLDEISTSRASDIIDDLKLRLARRTYNEYDEY